MKFVIQASSTNWSGGLDYCMYSIDGHPVIFWMIKRIIDRFPNAVIFVIAPEFDTGGALDKVVNLFNSDKVTIYYGYNDSPLDRMLHISMKDSDQDYFIRIDGMHLCCDLDLSINMLERAKSGKYDCVKPEDDFPAQLSSEVYRVGSLRKVKELLSQD